MLDDRTRFVEAALSDILRKWDKDNARIKELEADLGSQAEATAALYFERAKLREALERIAKGVDDSEGFMGMYRACRDIARQALEGESK